MKIQQYLPAIGWRRLTRKEELALRLDRFQKYEGLFVTWKYFDKSWRLYVRKLQDPQMPSPPLAPA